MKEIMLPKKRMLEQDSAKGFLMILILLIHSQTLFSAGGAQTGASIGGVLIMTFMGFAMPFFMIISGYNYRDKGETYLQSIAKRAKQLLLPLLIYVTAIWIIMGTYLVIRGETTPDHLLNSYLGFWVTDPAAAALGLDASKTLVGQMVGPTWFIKSMFSGYLVFFIVAPFIKKNKYRLISFIILLLLVTTFFSYFKIRLPWMLDAAPMMAALMLIGCLFKEVGILERKTTKTSWKIINVVIVLFATLFIQIHFFKVGTISAGRIDSVIGPAEIVYTALFGIFGTYAIITLFSLFSHRSFIGKYLIWFGQRTLITLIIHGSLMRFFSDALGVTGEPSKFSWQNLVIFLGGLATVSLFLYLRDQIKKKIKKKREAVSSSQSGCA